MTTMTDLLLPRGSTKYKEQVQKLLDSQPAVKKDRAGELALGNSFLGLPGRGVVSRLGVQGRLKNRVGGRGRGEMARGGGSGPRSGADLETPKTQLYQHAKTNPNLKVVSVVNRVCQKYGPPGSESNVDHHFAIQTAMT